MAVKGAAAKRSTGRARTRAERQAKNAASTTKSTKASTKASGNGGQKRGDARARDKELMPKVVADRKAGESWGDIAKKYGLTPGKAAFLVLISEVKPKDKVKGDSDEAIAKAAIKLRLDEGLGWGQIAARVYHLGIPEPRIKALAMEHATATQKKELAKNVASKRAAAKPNKASGSTRTRGSSAKSTSAQGSRRRPSN